MFFTTRRTIQIVMENITKEVAINSRCLLFKGDAVRLFEIEESILEAPRITCRAYGSDRGDASQVNG